MPAIRRRIGPWRSAAGVLLYAAILVGSVVLHQDLRCNLASRPDCVACRMNVTSDAVSDPTTVASLELPDAGEPAAYAAAVPPQLHPSSIRGRAPPRT